MKDVVLIASIVLIPSLGFAFLFWAATRWVARDGGVAAYLSWSVAVTLLSWLLFWRWREEARAVHMDNVGIPIVSAMLWAWLVLGAPAVGTALVVLGRRLSRGGKAP